MNSPTDLICAFSGMRVLVIGDAMLDRYLAGTAGKLCREAPVPIVNVSEWKDAPGGAANTAVNIASMGGRVRFLSVIGDDPEGQALTDCLQKHGIAVTELLRSGRRRTLAKQRVLASGQMLLRFDQGSAQPIDEETEQTIVEKLLDHYSGCDAIVVSDYCYGVLTPRIIHCISSLQKRWNKVLVVDSKNLEAYRDACVTAVKPNYGEALALLNITDPGPDRVGRILECSDRILERTGARAAAVTLDSDGAILFERGNSPYRTYARPASGSLATGAGDTFAGTLALALAAGAQGPAAAELASAAAAIVVGKEGTAACSCQELLEHFAFGGKVIQEQERLIARMELYRNQGRRIVFTNGCFDILHRGHITYLSRAKSLGDILIVGVNSDESIQRLKGPSRPINHLEDRVQVLAALSCVDHLVPFTEDTPVALIECIRPDIFVKGGDYTRETLPEAEVVDRLGGKVEILPYLDNRSTSGIIEKIRELDHGKQQQQQKQSPIAFRTSATVAPIAGGEGGGATIMAISPRRRQWSQARNVLCVRLDTIGDVLMTTPAIRAVRQSDAGRRVTLLTSGPGAEAASLVPEIDEVIEYQAPWMKASDYRTDLAPDFEAIGKLRARQFDAAIIFTVYSQNPLPAALFCHLAGIPLRLAHSRENPYQLLTDWVRETEPADGIRHEVERQLDLVATVGYEVADRRISVAVPREAAESVSGILERCRIRRDRPLVAIHAGATAASRRYPPENFAEVARRLALHHGFQLVFTGSPSERDLVETIRRESRVETAAALLDLSLVEFAALLADVDVVISNNTSAVHIASGVGTPVVDLYALTNPQHVPWQVASRVLFHDVPCKYCYSSVCPERHHNCLRLVEPGKVVDAVLELLGEFEPTRSIVEGNETTSAGNVRNA